MKKNKLQKTVAVALAAVASLGITVAAAYDSSEDPLISLSYLNEIFKPEIIEIIDQKIDDFNDVLNGFSDKVDRLDSKVDDALDRISNYQPGNTDPADTEPTDTDPVYTEPADTDPADTAPIGVAPAGYEVIELTYGQALYAVNACEIILRSGSAVVIAPDARQGLSNLTDGRELYNGDAMTKNHLCLIPRGDGRGIYATAQSVYVMVRGEYTIVK